MLVVDAYGGACECCGEAEPRFLTIDHPNFDGQQHRAQVASVYRDLRDRGWPKGEVRLLCMNCNWAQRFGDPCPHDVAIKKVFSHSV